MSLRISETTGILKLVVAWQKTIAAELSRHQPQIALSVQYQISVRLIIIILALQIDQSSQVPFAKISGNSLRSICSQSDTYPKLLQLWQHRFSWLNLVGLELPADLQLKDALIQSILSSLFYPNPNQFRQLPIATLGQVYEALLETDQSSPFVVDKPGADQSGVDKSGKLNRKKRGGIYYTPEPIVRSMVEAAMNQYSLFHSSEHISKDALPNFLDPACGGGAFLLNAYQTLLDRRLQTCLEDFRFDGLIGIAADQWELSSSERQCCLAQIYGVDVDAQAVAIAQLSLAFQYVKGSISKDDKNNVTLTKILHHNIRCGNSLIDTDFESASVDRIQAARPFHWQTAFPDIFAQGGFDLVVGNPPYIDAEWMTNHLPDWRSYCAAHYQAATGNWDLFCVFIEKALQLCRKNGCTSLIVPNKLLSADYAQGARSLLAKYQIILLQDYAQVPLFDASVYPLVYLAQKTNAAANSATLYKRMQTIDVIAESYPIQLQDAIPLPVAWRIETHRQTKLMQHLDQFPHLGELVQVTGAATVAEAYLLQDKIWNQPQPELTDLRMVNSGTIDRYLFLWGQKPLRYLGQLYLHPVIDRSHLAQISDRRLSQAIQPKIIVAGMTQKLECALDQTGGILAGKSTSIMLQSHFTLDLRYLLGLLNSDLLSYYFRLRFGGNRLQSNYFRIGPPQLRQLPIVLPNLQCPTESLIYQSMIECVDQQLLATQHQSDQVLKQQLDQKIDRLVGQLYRIQDDWY